MLLVLIAWLFSRSRVARMVEDRVVDARFALVPERRPDPTGARSEKQRSNRVILLQYLELPKKRNLKSDE